jgi:hypothetical protein
MYELANRRYPGNERIRQVLGTLNRVVQDHEYFGWASVLLYGAPDPGSTEVVDPSPEVRTPGIERPE